MVQSINRNRPQVAVQNLTRLNDAIAEQQRAIATGQRIDSASDDPQAWVEISSLSRQQSDEQAWMSNIDRAQTRADRAETAVDTMTSGLIRTKELLIQSSSDTLSANDREGIALEMENVLATINDLVTQQDGYGGDLFPEAALSIPIGENRSISPAPSRTELLDGIGAGNETLQQVLTLTIDAVRSGTTADRQDRLGAVDGAIERMTTVLTRQGVTSNALESVRVQYEDNGIALTELRSRLEDTDVTEAITRLQTLDTSLEAARAIYARIEQQNLLNFL
jgi:flagellar hook-associated protein 3 FlgL